MNKEIKSYYEKIIKKIIEGENITRKESEQMLIYLLDKKLEEANDVCFGSFFAALQTKKPTINEVTGLMDAVLNYDRKSIEIERSFSEPLCGIIGSGKDELKTFNISSISSIVAASCGVKVLKNGSRSESSIAGTTDVFEELGANVLNSNKATIENSLNACNFAFCDAKPFFPKMVKEYLGKYFFVHPLSYILPIASGVSFDRVVFGLANDDTEFTAELLIKLGFSRALVVAGKDEEGRHFDEISNVGKTKITEIENGDFKTFEVKPENFGLKCYLSRDISQGDSVRDNAEIFLNILSGIEKGPKRDIVLLNSGALIYISGLSKDIMEGMEMARYSIDNGAALKTLNCFLKVYK